ncbi:pyoverdin chromophore biosynthetic protein pvcC [Siccirubricoccus deserti]|uniref:Pyoverdin chromophore biosynthetic protein pvcC n=1 Tax=Siccirubricoccus deserti TaxID=2013562 RepID=A0A9X0R028_9PROT|nr:4-hydroxyphenylacetate 3-hydroxylase N-terminal domain-containing protein [Siccirubricoccus deserti]MBC4017226.1 Pyoverdin chromophore biosynthetic protein pvcC [Siccirubricoccus deserti]GGC54404.1 pyoverdin chromophore biosynthetic protein pvcC [Siccirubricoccus deserti]
MLPEAVIASPQRPFTGAEYIQSLRDGRAVFIDGERVADVTTHPAFRTSIRSIARLYDALHDPRHKDILTCPTDTGSGGYTHRYFRVSRSREDLRGAQAAIAGWARLSYGWMGRTPDYKAAFSNTLGGFPEYYGAYADNARRWYRRAQEAALFMNHAIVNPPVDRHKPPDSVKDVFVSVIRETDAGIYVSGAKVVATSAAMTHYNFMGQSSKSAIEDLDMSLMFMVPMNAPGLRLICRTSYEAAARHASPFDYPLSSRFDENDAIFVLDNVFIPWEDVFIYRDPARIMSFFPGTGFLHGAMFQGCTRYAVKLDFIAGLLAKALRCTGGDEARSNQVLLGEVIAWRHLFWSLSNAMANNPTPWRGDAVLPELRAAVSYRVFAPDSYPRIKDIVQRTVTSALIYLPSSVKDLASPETEPYLRQYVRGSHGIGHQERIKIMKLLWDAVGTEFAGRHELYERNYSGGWEDIRAQALTGAQRGGDLAAMEALVDQCLSDYDESGWTGPSWQDGG